VTHPWDVLNLMDKEWETFLHGLNSFSDDYFSEGRDQGINQEREEL
jgi:antitoxin VapB